MARYIPPSYKKARKINSEEKKSKAMTKEEFIGRWTTIYSDDESVHYEMKRLMSNDINQLIESLKHNTIISGYEELSEKIREVYKLINYQNVEFEWNENLRKAREICNEIQSKLNKPNVSEYDLRFKIESDKSLIYDSKTDKDICMYFDEDTRDWLLNLLNKK